MTRATSTPTPYLSVVAASRNDDHGGDPLRRTQIFINCFARQCEKYQIPAELILVDWNPVAGRLGLASALQLPSEASFCQARIITVPAVLHDRFKYADRIPFYQMIAKNVGIRRARGRFIVATNIDIIFSDELMRFIGHQKLDPRKMLRADRYDIHSGLTENMPLDETLDYAWKNPVRSNRRFEPKALVEHLYGDDLFKRQCLPDPKFCEQFEGIKVINEEGYWSIRPQRDTPISKLHTNACGDFTLLSREGWEVIHGYAEFASYSFHIDSFGLATAQYAGFEEIALLPPCVCFHIEHSLGSGWTPEGEKKLFARLQEKKILSPEWEVLNPLMEAMRTDEMPAAVNGPTWGLANFELPDEPLLTGRIVAGPVHPQSYNAPTGLQVGALLQLYDLDRLTVWQERGMHEYEIKQTLDYLHRVEKDRDDRLETIEAYQGKLAKAYKDHEQTITYLKSVEKDSADRLSAIQVYEAEIAKKAGIIDQTVAYLQIVEKDRADRLDSIHAYQDQVKKVYADLDHNVAYLKALEGEIAAHIKVNADKDAIIANLVKRIAELEQSLQSTQAELRQIDTNRTAINVRLGEAEERLRTKSNGQDNPQSEEIQKNFAHFGRHIRNVIIAKYHERLLPQILQLSAAGVTVEVFESPAALASDRQGTLRFLSKSLWEWLAEIDCLFNEKAYLNTHPDIAEAVATGALHSGWEHFMLFGQYEGRQSATKYFAGLAEFDAIAFDGSDANTVIPCLCGRLQPHHRLFVSGHLKSESMLRALTPSKVIGPDLLLFYRPPTDWLGPRIPTYSTTPDENWPRLRRTDIYPPTTPSRAEWPTISIVTVSYNQAEFLEETLRSVLDQNYPNLEYIVVDGGSTDGSVEIIQRYASRLTWWVSEKDAGQSQALNKGFRKATGQILAWVNSDDRLAPGSLFAIANAFAHHRTDLVVGRCARVIDQEPIPYHLHCCKLPQGKAVPLPLAQLLNLEENWQQGHFFHQPEVFFTKEIFDRSGGSLREDLYYSMDYDLWIRMAKAGASVLAIPEITAIFRQHGKQKTGGNHLPFLPELRAVNEEHLGKV